jgi:serine/threonine-protein kinase RsbW
MTNPGADNRGELRPSALRWRRVFPGDDAQISVLRRWLEWLLPSCSSRDDLMSVAVELGTNAVRHTASGAGGDFVVEVTYWIHMLRVAVYDDGGPSSPRLTEDLLCEDGRGLLMVNALSARMGVGGNAQGRVVWADIPWTGHDIPNRPEFHELTSASPPQELERSLSWLNA